ncbi:SAM-dependent methyltransferase [Streptomyces sp. NPDC093097]|uniref:SAM-dependent methyltransferase n=1 Tax=Streptomyces sp. NPDC093097 TaxID=3366027 RepID=UPI0038260CC9
MTDALAPGSCPALTYVSEDFEPDALQEVSDSSKAKGSQVDAHRRNEVLRFFDRFDRFDGFDLVDPG